MPDVIKENGVTVECKPHRNPMGSLLDEWSHHWLIYPVERDVRTRWKCVDCDSVTWCDPAKHIMFQPCSKSSRKGAEPPGIVLPKGWASTMPQPPVAKMDPDGGVPLHSGSKYLRLITGWCPETGRTTSILVDVYDVCAAFGDPPAPRSHAIKKLLCAGIRGKGGRLQDLREARDALTRDIQKVEQEESAAGGQQENSDGRGTRLVRGSDPPQADRTG